MISLEEIADKAEKVLTDKEQLILVYCCSGWRSKLAAEVLVELSIGSTRCHYGRQIKSDYLL